MVKPPDLPAIDSHSLALSMATERSQSVVLPAPIGVSVPPVPPTSAGGSQTMKISVEAGVSHSPVTISIIEVPCSPVFPDIAGVSLLSAAPTDSAGAYWSNLPMAVGQLSPPALSTAGQTSLPTALDSVAPEFTRGHSIEGGRHVWTRKPTV